MEHLPDADSRSRLFVTKPSVRPPISSAAAPGSLKNTGMAQMHNYGNKAAGEARQGALKEFAHAKASPQPLDDTFFHTPMPPSSPQHAVLVFHEARVFTLDKHLLGLLAAEEGDLFGELG